MPARDTQARFRFGHDPGEAAAALSRASPAWHLGEVGAALGDWPRQAVPQLAAELGHLPTSAGRCACISKCFLRPGVTTLAATLRLAEVLLALVRGGGMELYVAACQGLCLSFGRADD